MRRKNPYVLYIIIHIILGLLLYYVPFTPTVYPIAVFIIGIIYIVKNRNKNNEALYAAAYFVGAEMVMRMAEGLPFYEMGKYSVIVFMLIGMLFSGIRKSAGIYFLYILLLIPAIFITTENISYDTNIRKAIAFNLSGPVCLGISAMYCMSREISIKELLRMISIFIFPIVSAAVYAIVYTPTNIRDIVINTASNSALSGGFGANQVSTILGLGMFLVFCQILLNSKNKVLLFLNIILFFVISYRGIITFSRGGIITGLVMIIILIGIVYINTNFKTKGKLISIIIGGMFLSLGVWTYSSIQTSGLIENRYANEDALGREKGSVLTGRETLMATELEMFFENPITGVGVGRNKEIREEETGINLVTHSEVTRLLAEHGMLGFFALLILIFVPLNLYPTNKQNIFLLSFFFFWALTINHAAMRLAAPAFVYALSLLKVNFNENPPLYRQQTL